MLKVDDVDDDRQPTMKNGFLFIVEAMIVVDRRPSLSMMMVYRIDVKKKKTSKSSRNDCSLFNRIRCLSFDQNFISINRSESKINNLDRDRD